MTTRPKDGARWPEHYDITSPEGHSDHRRTFTLKRALSLPCFRGAHVVAGEAGLTNALEAVAVLDVTDFAGVTPKQFVISNAYPLRELDLPSVVDNLVRAGAAGLGLKLSEYWIDVPSTLVAAADRTGFPVLVLPEGPFDEIVNPLLTAIAGHQVEALRDSGRVHDDLTRAALHEKGDPSSVVSTLSRALRRPVAILNESGALVAWSNSETPWTPESLRGHVLRGTTDQTVKVDDSYIYLASAPATGTPRATVCVWDVEHADAFTRSAIAHAAVVAGMLLVGRRQVEEIYKRYERELLEDLAAGRAIDPDEVRSRAERVGWPLHRPYLVLVVSRSTGLPTGDDPSSMALTERDVASIDLILQESRVEGRVFMRSPGVGLVIHLSSDEHPRSTVQALAEHMSQSGLGVPRDAALILGVGRPRMEVTALSRAFREATIAFRFHPRADPGSVRVVHFSDLGAISLLSLTQEPERMLATARRVLDPLLGNEQSRGTELLATLAALLSRNMNISRAADDLFFHYNTVRYRLQRLRSSLGHQLEDPQARLLLGLAVSAVRLFESLDPNSPQRLSVPFKGPTAPR